MLKIILIILGILGIPTLYVLFSDPKPHNWRELGRYSTLFKSSLKPDRYSAEKEVFQTLKDAGIEPCFLNNDLSATKKTYITVPVYSDKNYRDLIVKPRTIWAKNRPNTKNNPIEF